MGVGSSRSAGRSVIWVWGWSSRGRFSWFAFGLEFSCEFQRAHRACSASGKSDCAKRVRSVTLCKVLGGVLGGGVCAQT